MAVFVGTMKLALSMAIIQVLTSGDNVVLSVTGMLVDISAAIMQVTVSIEIMLVVLSATLMLVDLFVSVMKVTVLVAIMQLEFSATLTQVKVSAANMWVTIFIETIQVGASVGSQSTVHYAHYYFYCNYAGGCFRCSHVCDSFK